MACSINFRLIFYLFYDANRPISGINNMANSNNVKHSSGKLSDHFAFKVNDDGKVEDGEIIEDLCR